MSTRMWAAIGNLLRVVAALSILVSVLGAARLIDWLPAQPSTALIAVVAVVFIVEFVVAALFWMAKGPLISGSLIARFLAGLYMLVWIVSTVGLALLFLAITYLFTSEPEISNGIFTPREPAKPRFTPPLDWRATARTGPSGAMLYSNADREACVGIFTSGLPVQVMDKCNGLGQVVAATGEHGWIDLRTLSEGV